MSTIALHSPLNISETVKDTDLVPKDDKQEMAVTDDVMWPWKVKLVTPIRLEPNISKTLGDAIWQQTLIIDSLLWDSTVGYLATAWLLVFRCHQCHDENFINKCGILLISFVSEIIYYYVLCASWTLNWAQEQTLLWLAYTDVAQLYASK